MRLIGLAVVLALGLLAAPFAAEAQPAQEIRRIGVLGGWGPSFQKQRDAGLRRLGWVEGQNIVVERLEMGDGSAARQQELARDLVRLKIEVIMVGNNALLTFLIGTGTTLPIVMVNVADPVGSGYIASLARPGGNITGLSDNTGPEMGGKRLDLLVEVRPGLSRFAFLLDTLHWRDRTNSPLEAFARSRGIVMRLFEVGEPGALEATFATIVKDRIQGLIISGGQTTWARKERINALALQHRFPTVYQWREGVEAGGLFSYGVNVSERWFPATVYVDKILKGAKPADLPVEQPTKFELVINLKTAKALGLTIPQTLLLRADEVIQ